MSFVKRTYAVYRAVTEGGNRVRHLWTESVAGQPHIHIVYGKPSSIPTLSSIESKDTMYRADYWMEGDEWRYEVTHIQNYMEGLS
jgi:hypothetical protein